ncbi:hypothetical protein ACFL14_00425 [Patescibacteria group bacterium]
MSDACNYPHKSGYEPENSKYLFGFGIHDTYYDNTFEFCLLS